MVRQDPSSSSRGRRRPLKPFTLAHFEAWATKLILDNGRPWRLEPFQAAFIRDVFAGTPECWLIIPEGNGKTTLVAGLALYHIQHRPGGMVPVAASSRDQTGILYRQAEGFVDRSPTLRGLFKCQPGLRRILYRTNGEFLDAGPQIQVFAADDRTGDGVIPTLGILDELHRHETLRLYRTWRGKVGKRGGQIVAISTAGEPGGEFEETRERIRQSATDVERGETFLRAASEHLVLHEWAVPAKGNVEDLELVKRANPFSGITVADLKVKRTSPTMTLQHWRRMNCNLPTRSEKAAIQEAEWFDVATTQRIPPGERIWLGLDFGWKWDTTAAVPLWEGPEFRLLGPARILVPPRNGTMLEPQKVKDALIEIHAANPIHTVVMDMTSAADIAAWISDELGVEEIIDRGQGNEAACLDYERFMEGLRTKRLRWSAPNPGLTRHVLNAVTRTLPGGKARFDRKSSAREGGDQESRVIDALQAAGMVNSSAVAGVDLAANIW